jgi:methionyl-tRNA synthetase
MSKSTLTGISPHELIETFGSDGYRYYFLREVSFGLDGSFSWEGMVARYNSDLANDLGNLANRVLSMMRRYLGGVVPPAPEADELTDAEGSLRSTQNAAFTAMSRAVDDIAPHEAMKACWAFVRKANAYVEEVAPWALAKQDASKRRLEVVLYELAESLRLLALMISPAMPRAAQELWGRLGQAGEVVDRRYGEDGAWGGLMGGTATHVGDPLFPRLEDEEAS